VPIGSVEFPHIPNLKFAPYMPQAWRMDYGPEFARKRVISNEPPTLGAQYRVLVPQVDTDGNDFGGIRLPETAVPLGTYAGWNITVPQLSNLQYLAGLVGSFEPFPRKREDRLRSGDSRLSIEERYADRKEYVRQVTRAVDALVRDRFILAADVSAVVQWAQQIWDTVAP
jgi:hypothetical protein